MMRTNLLLTLATIVSLFGSPAFAQNVDSVAGKKTVFLGDSITQAGGYVTFASYYLNKLYPQKNFEIYGLGLSSETLSGLSEEGHAGGKFPRPCLFERLGRLLELLEHRVGTRAAPDHAARDHESSRGGDVR